MYHIQYNQIYEYLQKMGPLENAKEANICIIDIDNQRIDQ